jgi:heme/copper-type cytochrome/quinol oxidase subunit 3
MSTPEATLATAGGRDHAPPQAGPTTSTGKVGMWIFLATDAMGFAGLLMAYAVLRVGAVDWPDPAERLIVSQAAYMTGALVMSSFTMTMAVRARGATARMVWLATTIVLGLVFLAGQMTEYQHLVAGPHPMGLSKDLFAGTFYAITGYHGLHVLAGLVVLIAMLLAGGGRGRSLEVAAIFWHFIDLAWIPIFSLLYLLPVT